MTEHQRLVLLAQKGRAAYAVYDPKILKSWEALSEFQRSLWIGRAKQVESGEMVTWYSGVHSIGTANARTAFIETIRRRTSRQTELFT